ncbi:UNVERIFIED_CONTAM: hypothetical protein Scaly_1244000 [Sesamum calycinum]|uniref:SWIB domain-containing protein n=1 Tax=Sesamum calycinum TaxID=2727403 RepID=A0AAW2Q5L5_9LAMI
MSERGGAAAPPAGLVVTEQQIAEALEALLRETNTFTSLNGVVQQLESKLGVNLSHRVDFIRSQIQHFLRLQAQHQNFMSHHHHQGNFALNQTPNFHPVPSPHLPPNFTAHHTAEGYSFHQPPPSQPQLSQPPPAPPVAVKNPSVTASVSAKESVPTAKKRRGGPGGLNKLCGVSPELQTIVGQPALPRTEDPLNPAAIICDAKLQELLGCESISALGIPEMLARRHLYKKS